MNHLDQKNPELASRFTELATRNDAARLYADLSATLSVSRDAVSAHLDRGLRRMVLALSAVMVASVAAAVLAARLAS